MSRVFRSRPLTSLSSKSVASFVGVAVTGIGAGSAHAATFEVTSTASSGAGSLADAVALANAAPGADTIEFKAGVTGAIDVTGAMPITDEVVIVGPGEAVVTLDASTSNRVFEVTGSKMTVSGLTIAKGESGGEGGAIDGDASAIIVVDDCTFFQNYAYSNGGAIEGNDVTITNSQFIGNETVGNGGAIAIGDGGKLSVSDTVFHSGDARDDGGAIFAVNATVMIADCEFGTLGGPSLKAGTNNTTGNGGAVATEGGMLTVRDSSFSSCSTGQYGEGGAISGHNTVVEVTGSCWRALTSA